MTRRYRSLALAATTLLLAAVGAVVLVKTNSSPSSGPVISLPGEAGWPVRVASTSRYSMEIPADIDANLRRVGRHLRQELASAPSVSAALHLMRVEGQSARFRPAASAGDLTVLSLLTDSDQGREIFGGPMLVSTLWGVRYPTFDSTMTGRKPWRETHRDQCLAAFGEAGVPLSYRLRVDGADRRLAEVLNDSIAGFHLGQEELVWTALAYTLYLPPQASWTNRFGESTSFDGLANKLLAFPAEKSSCGGVHLVYTLTTLLRVDETIPVLSAECRSRLRTAVFAHVARAIAAQAEDGSWRADWISKSTLARDDPGSRLLATGHVVEWLLRVPEGVAVPDSVIKKGASWLMSRVTALEAETIRDNYCPVSHTVCVLQQLSVAVERSDAGRVERARPIRQPASLGPSFRPLVHQPVTRSN